MRTRLVEQPFTPVAIRTERESHAVTVRHGERVQAWGANVMRGGLGLIFLWFGCMKFTSYEATGIAPFIMNSPLVGWWHSLLGIQGTSYMLGVFELGTGALLLAGFVKPLFSTIGGAMSVIVFLTTLSFLFTTPGVAEPLAGGFPALSGAQGQFLLKDLGLLGISLFILGSSLSGARSVAVDGRATIYADTDKVGEFGHGILLLGKRVLRYGLVVIFLWFGCMKFTSYEATGIAPFIMNSPLVGWWHSLLGIQGASTMLGIFEITTGILLALCPIAPRASVLGGAMAVFTFLITLSFFLTTPGVAAPMGFPAISGHVGQFLLKDAGLLGISIWLLGEALVAMTTHAAKTPNTASRYGCKTL